MNKNSDKEKLSALARFYENLASKYGDAGYYTHPIGIHRKKKIIKMLYPQKSDIICDLGCGDGNLSRDIVKKAKKIYGADISPTRVKKARKNGIDAVCADVCSTPFKSNYFDKVICSEVIEHVINPKELIHELNRLIKKGGIAALTVPFNQKIEKTLLDVPKEDLEQMDYEEIKKKYHVTEDHLNSFSEEGFIKLLEEAGFIIKQVDYTHKYELRFKIGLIYSVISLLKIKFINRSNIAETIYNKIIFLFYKEKEDKGHIVVQACKK
jgi:2-polyprenyl-3-methyl-5-hydroxy-6-metoxy-1,4-benzoquinol methylase